MIDIGLILVRPGVMVAELVSLDAGSVTEIVHSMFASRSKLNVPSDLVKPRTVSLPSAVAVTNAQTSFASVDRAAVPWMFPSTKEMVVSRPL